MLDVEQWAEIRRMHEVEGLSIREIARRSGRDRNTVRTALRSAEPPRYRRERRASKLDPFKEEIGRLLKGDAKLPGKRIRELIAEDGYEGSRTILDDYLREFRPLYQPPRTYQRTSYRAGELLQFDVWAPSREIPVGHGQTRPGYVLTCALGYSRAAASTLVFSKQGPDLRWGISRCLTFLGALPQKLVWDREGPFTPAAVDRPRSSPPSAAPCRSAGTSASPATPRPRGSSSATRATWRPTSSPAGTSRDPSTTRQSSTPGSSGSPAVCFETIRARPAERLSAERESMRALPEAMPDTDRRFVIRVPPQPYLRWDTNDYSLDPRLAGRRVEVRISQQQITATALDTGELGRRHRRSFAKGLTFTAPAHQASLDQMRGDRRRGPEVEVEQRPLERYDALIPV